MSKPIDITGHRFGRLVATRRHKQRPSFWVCKCDCGRTKSVLGSELRRPPHHKGTRSCGCLLVETQRARFRKMNADPAIKLKQRQSLRWFRSRQWHESQSRRAKERWANPDYRVKVEQAKTQHTRELLSRIMGQKWQQPEYRARMLKSFGNRRRATKEPSREVRHHPFRQPSGRFTPLQIQAMLQARSEGKTYKEIGSEFGCSDVHASLICRGKVAFYLPAMKVAGIRESHSPG